MKTFLILMGVLVPALASAQTDPSVTLARAIQRQWPGAEVVIRDGAVDRWDGPMAEPSASAIAQALTAYEAVQHSSEADARTDARLDPIIDDVLTALLENFQAIAAEASAGTLPGNISVWKQRIRARVRTLERAKP